MSEIIGCNERWYFPEGAHPDGENPVCVRTVLVAGDVGDYAAYQGIGSKDYVARHGDKVSFEEANAHFCGVLEREKYRL